MSKPLCQAPAHPPAQRATPPCDLLHLYKVLVPNCLSIPHGIMVQCCTRDQCCTSDASNRWPCHGGPLQPAAVAPGASPAGAPHPLRPQVVSQKLPSTIHDCWHLPKSACCWQVKRSSGGTSVQGGAAGASCGSRGRE